LVVRQKHLNEASKQKLNHRFYEPYQVVEQIGTQAYHLEHLQQAGSIHNVFHVLLLELYVYDGYTVTETLPPIEIDSEEVYKLKEIHQSQYRYRTLCYRVRYK
jgi:hypothetical protein